MYFTYNNKNSDDVGIKVRKVNNLSSPQIRYEKKEIPGKQGNVIYSNGDFENFLLEIECSLDARENKNIKELSIEIKRWLQTNIIYKKLNLSNDEDYYFEAICCNKLDFEHVVRNYKHFILTFECKPFRKHINGYNKIIFTSPKSIFNNYMKSKPNIKIIGSGDITLNINNQQLILKGIEGEIEIDSEIMNAYKIVNGKTVLQNNKMYSNFPILEEGRNNISWTGNVTRVEIIPRWCTL